MRLSECTQERDNNFQLLRILAALAILVDHSFALAIGSTTARPLMINSRMDISLFALDVFFFTSGFLVTSSLMRRQHLIEFAFARVLRIYPALLVMQLLTVFGLGLFLTTIEWPSYLWNYQTLKFWIKDSILIDGLVQTLPGVFQKNPLNNTVNSPLWTLPYELGLYGTLAAVWAVLSRLAKSVHAFRITMVGCALAVAPLVMFCPSCQIYGGSPLRLAGLFCIGAAAFVFRDRIVLSGRVLCSLLIVLPLLFMLHEQALFAAYVLTLPYLLLYLAYVPAGFVRKYNQLGDYSYGLYIYGWPLQQTIVFLSPGISVPALLLLSVCATLTCAVLSWHVIEQPALQLKNKLRQMLSGVEVRYPPLSRDAMMVRNADGTIRYWSDGAQKLYGWEPQDALGTISHQLLKTIFPAPLDTIEAQLRTKGYWDGQLTHERRDKSKIKVASHWELQQNPSSKDQSITVIEINSPQS